MLACVLLTTASLLGLVIALKLEAPLSAWTRVGLGVAIGQVPLLWLPFALSATFDLSARAAGLWALALLGSAACVSALWLTSGPDIRAFGADLRRELRAARPPALAVAALLCAIAWLMYTHYLLPRADGLHSAGVTWGDLPVHVALATRFRDAAGLARLEHPLIAYGPLAYPFLPDHSVAVLTALDLPLRWAFVVGGFTPLAALPLVLHGLTRVWLAADSPARPVTHAPGAWTSALAIGSFFCASGLGFAIVALRWLDGTPLRELASINPTYLDPLVLKSASIGHLFVAARSATYGMSIGAAALLLLSCAVTRAERSTGSWLAAAIAIGSLPLIHGHSFVVLALACASYPWLLRRSGALALACWGLAALLALPQLAWLAAQGAPRALRLAPGLLRPAADLVDWLRMLAFDFGLWLVLVPLGFAAAGKRARLLSAPLLALPPIASVVTFTPAQYDNVKLLAWFDLGAAPLVAAWLARSFLDAERSVGRAARLVRRCGTALLALGCTLSGVLALVHELSIDALVASHDDVRLAAWVARHTQPDDVIATAASYQDPVAMFSGRRPLLAAPAMLSTHGIDPRPRAHEVVELYRGGPVAREVIARLGVAAVLVGPRERADLPRIDEHFLRESAREVHVLGDARLYILRGAH